VANLKKAREFAASLEADLGGTEIHRGLRAAYEATTGSESADIFVVTDGEVSSWEGVVAQAKESGHRIFTVGVGSAVSEAFVRGLAAATGGQCELVSPREEMADRVIRHFERMRAPRAKRVSIHWPEGARDLAPATFGAVFEGDTVTASAQFDASSVTGHVTLELETHAGDVFRQQLTIKAAPAAVVAESADRASTVARLAASARLKELDRAAGAEQAVRYRLVSPWTNWLVVAERSEGEKAFDIPALRKVPQTMAAGWGGTGRISVGSRLSAPAMGLDFFGGKAPDAAEGLDFANAWSVSESSEVDLRSVEPVLPKDNLDRDVRTLSDKAQRAVEALQEQAHRAEHDLDAIKKHFGDLQIALASIQKTADALRRLIGELESSADDSREERLSRVADLRVLLTEAEELLARLHEGRVPLGHLQDVVRKWAKAIMGNRG
jgi:hypothetical protein